MKGEKEQNKNLPLPNKYRVLTETKIQYMLYLQFFADEKIRESVRRLKNEWKQTKRFFA